MACPNCTSTSITAVRTESGVNGTVCGDCGHFHHEHRTPGGDGICTECRQTVYALPERTPEVMAA